MTHLFYALFRRWIISHNKKPFKNITGPNSVASPPKEKNMAQQSLWRIPCFHFSLVLYKIVGGEVKLLRGLVLCGNPVKLIEMADIQDKSKENKSVDGNYVLERWLDRFSVVLSRSVAFCFYFFSNPVLVPCLELKSQQGFGADSCSQDLLLLTSVIHRSPTLIGFFLPRIFHYRRARGEKLDGGCFRLHSTYPPRGPRRLFLGDKHSYPLPYKER